MSRQLELVVQGVVGTNPTVSRTSTNRTFCHFRLATTPTYRANDGTWHDGTTVWFTAKAWGRLAENLATSLRKGDPVLLCGRFTQEGWATRDGLPMTTNVLIVSGGGHDLSRGETRFMRTQAPRDERGAAEDAPEASRQLARSSRGVESDGSSSALDSAPSPDAAPQPGGQVCAPAGGMAGDPWASGGEQEPAEAVWPREVAPRQEWDDVEVAEDDVEAVGDMEGADSLQAAVPEDLVRPSGGDPEAQG